MATHQLWDGGPAVPNYGRTQYPSYTFASGDAKLQNIDVAQHYGTPYAVLRRVLDFKNDVALRNYVNNNTIGATDTLNLILLPKGCLVLAAYVEVEAAASGGAITATFGTASGSIFGNSSGAVAVNLATAAAQFSSVGGAWVAANGAVSLATAQGLITPDMAQMTLATKATAGLAGFGNLRLNYSVMIVQARENPATNF